MHLKLYIVGKYLKHCPFKLLLGHVDKYPWHQWLIPPKTQLELIKSLTMVLNCDYFAVIVEEAAEVLEAHIVASLSVHCQHLILIGKYHLSLCTDLCLGFSNQIKSSKTTQNITSIAYSSNWCRINFQCLNL